MSEEIKKTEEVAVAKPEPKKSARRSFSRAPRPSFRRSEPVEEFEQKVIDLARVTRVMGGGKRMKFRACMVIGDKKGRLGLGLAKGADVAMAIGKSVAKAKRQIITVPVIDGTVPHEVHIKFKAARIMIRSARKGSGIKAGGVVRIILELAGVKDAVAKIFGSGNKVNNAKATLLALNSFLPKSLKYVKAVGKTNEDKTKKIIVSKPVSQEIAQPKKNLTKPAGQAKK
jgi:small subunit ribosomal protein S5